MRQPEIEARRWLEQAASDHKQAAEGVAFARQIIAKAREF
jgi:hypothetical protein